MAENETNEKQKKKPPRPSWIRSLILGVVILACGGAIGSVITAVVMNDPPAHESHRGDRLPQRIAERMQRNYGLSDEQEQQILVIFEEHAKKFAEIWSEVRPRVDAEHEDLKKSVEAVLGPELGVKWREEYEQMRSNWHRRSEPPSLGENQSK